ncbi:MAG TPA: hypothetical protein VFW50_14820 [Streptosporangiaceae bacterium]|nr:hypothetical protein [Streptosporangiaceae bacterium]
MPGRGHRPGGYARALTRWPQVARYDLPEAWVRRVAIRLTVDALRRMGRAVRLSARLAAGWNENSRSGTRRCPMLDDELREQLAVWVRPVTALAIPDVRVLRGRARRRRIRRAATAATVTAVVAAVAVSVTVLGR